MASELTPVTATLQLHDCPVHRAQITAAQCGRNLERAQKLNRSKSNRSAGVVALDALMRLSACLECKGKRLGEAKQHTVTATPLRAPRARRRRKLQPKPGVMREARRQCEREKVYDGPPVVSAREAADLAGVKSTSGFRAMMERDGLEPISERQSMRGRSVKLYLRRDVLKWLKRRRTRRKPGEVTG